VCRNWKLWIGIGAVALVLAVAAPNLRPALPYLLLAACPLSMLAMAVAMAVAARSKPSRPSASGAMDDHDELASLRAEVATLRDHATR